ncbi:hypothetical protein [Roseateles asaccharophilus]|uniref:Uncharacterized protein n=1 Tax=Roseateles asaccharophilus TaxID=582607 RepID=A0ABU2A1E7_9BURK|nr:hypothetical protein [Roseateles asaccharophilus]MDR7331001.1 hypothetical protein [Roseateles asaccharophilus]
MPRRARFSFCWGLLAAAYLPAIAGGTLETKGLAPLFRQQPTQMADVRAAYELSDSAFAEARLGTHFTHLGGTRIGPYSVRLHRHERQEPRERELLICTKVSYLDRQGRELLGDAAFEAVHVKEIVTTMQVQDIGAPRRCLP